MEAGALVLLGGLILVMVWLTVEIQRLRAQLEPILTGTLGRTLAAL